MANILFKLGDTSTPLAREDAVGVSVKKLEYRKKYLLWKIRKSRLTVSEIRGIIL